MFWRFMHFSEISLKPVNGVITVPTADGSEAFIDAEDIAAVAAETLCTPGHGFSDANVRSRHCTVRRAVDLAQWSERYSGLRSRS